jgi:hypothetical protein
MPASTPADGIVNAIGGAVRKVPKRATRTLVHLAGRVLRIGDLALAQLVGLPGTQACCAYCWCGYSIGRRTDREMAANPGSPVAPASATAVRDRERS